MALTLGKPKGPTTSPTDIEEAAKYGVTRVPVDYFHYGEYRYTNLADAIAEAKRARTSR